ncbi:CBS domain-containing protein CBSX2, chloroplastic-like [Bidens hawaiensis]|uniref:CBS domain-containing protein CBSX2, chloroplastic-like n=1 Tax=Bidens hawaiensis TaxID=980011 RepID=UPI004049E16D
MFFPCLSHLCNILFSVIFSHWIMKEYSFGKCLRVGVVSDYDLLALDSISGGSHGDTALFPDVDSSWKTFNEIQKLLGKTDGKVVGDLMTPAPLVVHETSNLEEAVRLLLETKYRRLPVVDDDGKLIGLITRGDVVRAALQIKHAIKKMQLAQD